MGTGKKKYILLLFLIMSFMGCDNRLDWLTPENPTLPEVLSLSPTLGGTGTVLTITGINFSTVTTDNVVMVGGKPAVIIAASATELKVTIPQGAGVVPVMVTVKGNTASNQPMFTYIPTVSGLTPATGNKDTVVVITGANFSTVLADNAVTFGNTSATITAASATQLTVKAPAGAGAVPVAVNVKGQAATNKPIFTYVLKTTPVVNSLTPSTGQQGIDVVINGVNFSTVLTDNVVTFGGVSAVVTAASASQLTVKVPAGTGVVPVVVTVKGEVAVNQPVFTYSDALLVVTALNPSTGPQGISVIITGANFSTTLTNNNVTFNGVNALVLNATTTSLTVAAPTSTTGPVIIKVGNQTATNQPVFTYTSSFGVTSISPSSGTAGTQVTITGTDFNTTPANNIVTFNGVAATVISATATTLVVTAPSSTTGLVVVKNGNLTALTQPTFTYIGPPIVTSLSPASGTMGTQVTIIGQNFSATPANNIVTFNGVSAMVTNSTTTTITVTAPGSSTGAVAVKVGTQTAVNQPTFTYVSPPVVSGLSPTTGANGTVMTITGQNFSTTPGDNIVTINGVAATVTQATSTSLTVTIPDIAHDYDHACPVQAPVHVTVNGQPDVNNINFTYENSSSLTVFAGTANSSGFVNGNGAAARFNFPTGIVIDNSGNAIVSDAGNSALRKIDMNGNVSTLATVSGVGGMDVDAQGNVYTTSFMGIYKVTPAGVMTLINNHNWSNVNGIAVDNATGNLYVTDNTTQSIVKVAPDGTMSTLATGAFGFTGGSRNLLVYDNNQNLYTLATTGLYKITLAGVASFVSATGAIGLASDNNGNIYLSENTFPCKLAPDGTCCTITSQLTDYSFDVFNTAGTTITYTADFGRSVVFKMGQ